MYGLQTNLQRDLSGAWKHLLPGSAERSNSRLFQGHRKSMLCPYSAPHPCYLCRPLGKTVHRLNDGPGKNLSKQVKCSLPGSIRLCLSNHLTSREEPVRSKVSDLSWHLPYIMDDYENEVPLPFATERQTR